MSFFDDLELIDQENLDVHIYELFVNRSRPQVSHGLGFIERKNGTIEVAVGDRDILITQDLSQLNSTTQTSSTGFVAWKVSPLFFEWLQSPECKFKERLNQNSVVVEVGTGIAGIGPAVLGNRIGRYIATDQAHLLKLLKHNVDENTAPVSKKPTKRSTTSSASHPVEVVEFDWEYPNTLDNFKDHIADIGPNGVVIACDTIYNDYLIPHFVNAVNLVLDTMGPGSMLFLAQQLRSEEILESALGALISSGLSCYHIPDYALSDKLINGFCVHILTH
jgi:Lysine methyltransferase